MEINSEKGSQSVSNKNNKIHIAIVNEDQPTTYNGKKGWAGQAFIKKVSKWEKTINLKQ